jgi:hypothetical protein
MVPRVAEEDTMEQPSKFGKFDIVELGKRVGIATRIPAEILAITIPLPTQSQRSKLAFVRPECLPS